MLNKEDLKTKFKKYFIKISEVNNLRPEIDKRVNNLYAYLKIEKKFMVKLI